MSIYKVGSVVRSLVDAQGLRQGTTYEVVEVQQLCTPWGVTVTYGLAPQSGGSTLPVRNGHLVLESL